MFHGVIFIIFFEGIPSQDQNVEICWYPEGSGRFPEACPEAYTVFTISSQFRKVPEGARKLVRKLVSFLFVFLQFRKVPEGSRKLVRKLVSTLWFTAFRKVPEGFRNRYRKSHKALTFAFWFVS